ncbi:MAG: hypothetical protein IPJ78_19115 [Gemmatimonadetes bacterium]|nr:hypothetical protein [Gemmatimonadota bacterium]
MIRSVCAMTVVGSDARSLPVSRPCPVGCVPPLVRAVLVTVAAAVPLTVEVMVTAGYAPPEASASERVQVTTWPTMPQVHPVPVAAVGVSPAGSVSSIVTTPDVATLPESSTVTVYCAFV